VLVWPRCHSNIWIPGFISRIAKSWLLGFVLFAVTLVPSPAFAAGSVTLAWNASTDPGVAGYNVYYGRTAGAYTNKIQAGNATNATVSGLISGATYYFAATAFLASGMESPFSSEVSYRIPTNVPAAVPILNCSNKYSAVITANAPGFFTNEFNQVRPIPPFTTNYVFSGIWIRCAASGVWTLQSSSNLLTWSDYSTGTNAVFAPNTGGNRFFRLKPPEAAPVLNFSNVYIAVVTTNQPGFFTNRLDQVRPIPAFTTNFVLSGYWISYPASGVWMLQSSSNLLTWSDYLTNTNAVFIPNNGRNRFFRLKSP
jgi:hypothetical protein